MASMMTRMVFTAMIVCAEILTAGCAKSAHQTGQHQLQRLVPSDVLSQVDDTVSFNELRADPQQYTGRTVMLSGLALQSKRVKDGTEIEILQVPTERGLSPSDRKAKSEGRFLAVQSNGFLDPAVIEKEAPLTVVGEVKGVRTQALGESEYRYPVLDVKQLIDWNDVASRDRDRYWNDDDLGYYGRYSGYYGPWSSWYYGFGSPFSGPYGLYPYSYYGPYYAFPRGYSVPAPAPPPPSATPRLFHRE